MFELLESYWKLIPGHLDTVRECISFDRRSKFVVFGVVKIFAPPQVKSKSQRVMKMNVRSPLMLSARYFRLWSAAFSLLAVATYHSGFNASINKERNPQTPLEVTPVTYASTSPSVRLVCVFSLEMKLVMMNFGQYCLQLVMFLRVKLVKCKSWLLWKTQLGFCLIFELFCLILRACWWKFFSISLWLFKILEEDEIQHRQCLSHGGFGPPSFLHLGERRFIVQT